MSDYTLHLGDCVPLMKAMADEFIDCVLVDPPYGIDYQSARRTDKSQWKPKIANDKEPFLDWLPDAFRVTKAGGALVCFYRWDVEKEFKEAIEAAGFTLKSQIIWDKVVHGMGDLNGAFAPRHENMLFATKGNFSFWSYRPQDVIRCQRVHAEQLVHPNEKPISLLAQLIEPIVPRGGTVLDCCMGSGTTIVAAIQLGRKAIGIEIDATHFQTAKSNIEQAALQPRLFTDEPKPQPVQEELL